MFMIRLVADIPTGGTESKVEAIQSSTGEPCVLMKGLVLLESEGAELKRGSVPMKTIPE